jgi:membrane fusion protein, multidrug efflux system
MEQSYVVLIRGGQTDPVPVKSGGTMGNLTESFGDLSAGEEVALHASEDLRHGTPISDHPVGNQN